jgi:parvulin-like peptidyl-prolyl isomerase
MTFQRAAGMALGIYLVCDAFLHGPVFRAAASLLDPGRENNVARVFKQTITRSQLDRAVRERLWLEGKTIDSLTPENLKSVRQAALDELIDQELLRAKAAVAAMDLKVTAEEITGRLDRLAARFESKDEMKSAMKSQGIASERDLRDRLAARIQQEKFVESKIGPPAKVTDEEAKKWFDENQKDLTNPERVEVRHVFLPTLDHPPEEAKAKLESALADLTAKKKDFTTLAKELSEDPATKDNGGSLGWMTRDRLPVDFAAPVFSLSLNQPTLVRTRLGWHLVEVTGRKPAEPRTFEQAKPEILSALEAVKRRKAIADSRAALRKDEGSNIEVFQGALAK